MHYVLRQLNLYFSLTRVYVFQNITIDVFFPLSG
jgi:hypothetical protein